MSPSFRKEYLGDWLEQAGRRLTPEQMENAFAPITSSGTFGYMDHGKLVALPPLKIRRKTDLYGDRMRRVAS